ncbi:major facilitator superfamily domain-containing protein 1 [Patella vulgata]|uniref:major facilitator superfamily domain-containing protein 1 n=1 Tax=Patella vulgata TaxID=6465 RepID=UPI0024A9E260|nr:major facilitator superfamily domain-containing protein 1 [Patella vulgata]
MGTRFGALFFASIALCGSIIFAVSVSKSLRGSSVMFPLLLLGRLLLGTGNSGMRIVQDRVTAFWFQHKELSLAFGVTLSFSRLGSVINYLVTSKIVKHYGLEVLFWSCAGLCCCGFIFALILSMLDQQGTKKITSNCSEKKPRKKLSISDIGQFSATFWLLTIVTMFSYSTIIPYVADSSKLYQDKYGYSKSEASYIAGEPYDVAMVAAPIVGIIVDRVGYRGFLMIFSAAFTVPILPLVVFTNIPAYLASLIIGFNYTFAAVSMWPSVPLLVKPRALGTAMGILTSLQYIGIGATNVGMGRILSFYEHSDKMKGWTEALIFLTVIIIICLFFSILLNVVDSKQGAVLNKKRKKCLRDSDASSSVHTSESINAEERPLLAADFRSRIAPKYQALVSSAGSGSSFGSSINKV